MLDPVVTHIISLGLSVLFAASGIEKLAHRQVFVEALVGYQLLPQWLVSVASFAIPMVEVMCALSLTWSDSMLFVIAAAGLLALYGAAIFINIRRGNLSLDCGCQFGETRQSISMALVYRNLFLVLVASLLCLPSGNRLLEVFDYGAIAFWLLVSTLFYITVNRLIANATAYREVP
jgi:hypothetical protein